ncbi:MAG: PIN domain-containing protein [Planktomarina sp.]|nr:PIN domain-containing protein [Planktomarina sp.]
MVPSFLREVLLTCAHAGFIEPLATPRILEEWRRAAKTPMQKLEAENAIRQFVNDFPSVMRPDPVDLRPYWLPDQGDLHILALAAQHHADVIVTHNKKDFPQEALSPYGISRVDPDTQLLQLYRRHGSALIDPLRPILTAVQAAHPQMRTLEIWRKAWLPQFGRKFDRL